VPHHHHHQKQIEGKEKEKFGTILSRPQPLSPGITPKAVRILILFDVPRWIVVFNSAVRKIALVSFFSPPSILQVSWHGDIIYHET
jgi:hypothetical protein